MVVSNTTMIICLVIGLVLALVINNKTGINAGVLGFAVAWIVGGWLGKLSSTTIIGYWPTSVMFITISTTLFFGVARVNGTLQLLASKIIYATRKISWFPPIAIYLTAWIIGAAGAGAIAAETTMSAIGFSIAAQTGMHPLLVILAVFLGGMGGGGMFWSSEGANRVAYYSQVGGVVTEDVVNKSVIGFSAYSFIIYTIIFFIGYFIFKGWKNNSADIEMEKPAAYSAEQKKTLILIAVCMGLVVFSAFWKCFWPSAASKYIGGQLSIQMVGMFGALIAFLLKLAEPKEVMKKVPWDLILTIAGMSTLIKVLINCGITEMIGGVFEKGNIPNFIVPAIFFLCAGVITLFSNFTVIYPLLMPFVPVVAAATGINSITLFTSMALGSGLPGISPFSTGGACCLSGISDEQERQKMVPKLFIMSLVIMAFTAIIVMTPLLKIFPDCL